MATRESKTKWTLEFETERAEELKRKVEGITQMLEPEKLSDGFKQMERHMAMNERQMASMERTLKSLTRTLGGLAESNERIDQMGKGLGRARQETKALGEEAQRSGRFIQGMVQGLGIGEYLPAGRGMGRQVAGRMIGGAARRGGRMAGAFAGAPFTGTSGVAQGLGGIPFVGGLMGGQLMAAQATAQNFVQFQRTQLQLAPFMDPGRVTLGAQAAAAGVMSPQAAARAAGEAAFRGARTSRMGEIGGALAEAAIADRPAAAPGGVVQKLMDFATRRAQRKLGALSRPFVEAQEGLSPEEKERQFLAGLRPGGAGTRAAEAKDAAIARARQKAFFDEGARQLREQKAGLATQGRQLGGLNLQQTMQFVGQVMGAGGGTIAGAQAQGGIRAALAAQTAFGVGGGTSGAFLRAGRRGGIIGAEGRGGGAMVDAIQAAMQAGMDNTEVRDFLQQIAGFQEEFKRTGIPVAPQTVAAIGRVFAASGVGITRGGVIGTAITRRAQEIAQTGPRSAAEFQVLKQLGGFSGGGLRELEAAELKLEKGDFGPREIIELMKTFAQGVAGGGVFGRRRGIRRGVGALLGRPVGPKEARFLESITRPGGLEALTEEERGRVMGIQAEIGERGALAPQGLAGLEAQARTMTTLLASTVKRQATLDNERLVVGSKLVKSMQLFESTTMQGQKAFAEFGPSLQAAALALNQFAKQIPGAAKKLQELAGGDEPPEPHSEP